MKVIEGASKLKSILLIFFVLCAWHSIHNTLSAQTSSPYSRYGIGELNGKGLVESFGMGGTSIALQNDTTPIFFINTGNPASYSTNRLTTAELGVNFNSLQLQNSTTKNTVHDAGLGYLTMAFPIKRWWGASIGLTPYSSVYLRINHAQPN